MICLGEFEKKYKTTSHKTQILEFWKSIKCEFPEIHAVASIINGIPPAQATVERISSIVAFVFNEYRSRLGEILLQDILLIKANRDKLPKIFEKQVEALKAEYDVKA